MSSFSWFLLACLVALNYLRIALIDPSARGPKCGNVPSSSYVDPSPHRLLGGGAASRSSIACDTYVLIYAYFAMILLTVMAVGVYYIATVYLDRIIHKSLLIDKIADKGRHAYEKSLVLMIRKDKMLAHGISTVAMNISEGDDGETEHGHGHGHGHGKGHGHGHKKGHGHEKHATPSHTSIQVTSHEDDHHESDPPKEPAPKGSYALFRRRTSAIVSGFGEAFAPVGGGDLSDIFLFKSPGIFFKAVEAVLLFQCFAISIVFTQLLPLNVSTAKGGGWYVGFIILIMMNFYIIQMILNKSVLLRSVHSLERAIAGKICEDTVAERTAIANLREVVTAKLVHERIPAKERRSFLKTYFFQYDVRQTGEISRADFLRILGDLNIYMSTESFGLLWQVVDNDLSNKLDWLEISELFFPAAEKDDAPKLSNDIPAIIELRASMHKMLEDAKIPVFNWEEYIHTAFNKYDTDGSEEIDEVEFGAMLTSLDVRVTTKVLREVFSTIDLCQDGSISYDDFFAFIFPEIN